MSATDVLEHRVTAWSQDFQLSRFSILYKMAKRAFGYFSPGTPGTGPNRVFSSKTQYLCGKRVTWVHVAHPVHHSFWVRYQKCMFHLGPLGPEKQWKRPVLGGQREKSNWRLRPHRNFGRLTPWNRPDWWKNGPATAHFCRKSVFTCRRSRVDGAGGKKVPFRCNSMRRCASRAAWTKVKSWFKSLCFL